jgi:Uma2 family endonuclease
MQSILQKKTISDFARFPEGTLVQLIDGEIILSPSPVSKHQLTAMRLAILLQKYADAHFPGTVLTAPMDVYFNEHEAYQPDVMFISTENKSIIGTENIQGAPDMIVEILSPSTAYYDLRHKKQVYEFYGVKEYWIVDPQDESVEIYARRDKKFEVHSQAGNHGSVNSAYLAGLQVHLADLFRPI